MDASSTRNKDQSSSNDTLKLSPPAQLQAFNKLRKRCPSRETIVEMQRIALSLDGDDEVLAMDMADFLLEVRQALRGGRLNMSGGKHWFNDA